MNLDEFILVGSTSKPHGLKGEINIHFDLPLIPGREDHLKTLFLGTEPNLIPYFVETIKTGTGKKHIVKLEDIDNRDQAAQLSRVNVYHPENAIDDFFKSTEDTSYEQLIGYMVANEQNENLGKIKDVLELPQQKLAQVYYNEKEVLIPLNEASLLSIDKANKTVHLKIPAGLFDL